MTFQKLTSSKRGDIFITNKFEKIASSKTAREGGHFNELFSRSSRGCGFTLSIKPRYIHYNILKPLGMKSQVIINLSITVSKV